MAWQSVVVLNFVIAGCYFVISSLIMQGLVRTRQLSTNPLALATGAIFATCGLHHAHHAVHLAVAFDAAHADAVLAGRELFGEWHSILIEVLGAVVATTYLGLRHSYKTLLNTPAMFEDAVRVAAERQLRTLAFTDQLTGIPNRAAYQQYADSISGTDSAVTVLFIDLDGFKEINDTHGHDAGDRLLGDVAQRLVSDLGQDSRVFRIGGDEFVVIARDGEIAPVELAARAVHCIVQPLPTREDGETVVGASIGVASGPASGVDALLREADADMYRIKASRSHLPRPRGDGAPVRTRQPGAHRPRRSPAA